MYKININENTLVLMSSDLLDKKITDQYDLVYPYSGKTKMLLSYIDMLEKTNRYERVLIHSKAFKQLKQDFKSLFRIIKASGGIVEDEQSKVLMIFRRGNWDLPKGKIDPGESKKEAAVREVIEETGIDDAKIVSKLGKTRHVYRLKSGERVLKISYWYAMKARNQKLTPQKSEDILEAKWVNPQKFVTKDLPIYVNIYDILKRSAYL